MCTFSMSMARFPFVLFFFQPLPFRLGEPVVIGRQSGRVGQPARSGQLQCTPGNPPGTLVPQVGRRQPDVQPQFLEGSIA